MNQQQLEDLVYNATFSADTAAMEERAQGATNAQVTRRVVRRTIEFLYGNGFIEINEEKIADPGWLKIDPPFDRTIE